MNENRRDNQDMLENIIEDLSRENEFKVEDEAQPDTPRRPKPAPQKGGGKLWPAVIAALIILAATYYIFKSGSEPIENPAPPETRAATEEATASQPETLFPPAETPAETPDEAAEAANTPEATPPITDESAAADTSAPAPAADIQPTAPEAAASADTPQAGDSASDPLTMAEEEKAKAGEAARAAAEEEAKAEAQKTAEEKAKSEAAAKAEAKARAEAEAAQKEAEAKASAEAAQKEAKAKAAEEAKAEANTNPAQENAPTAPAEEAPAAAAPVNSGETNKAPLPPISNLWVVNISSTPDEAESLAILTKVMASDAGGQVYAYETTVDGKKQNRIRVGFFGSRAEAEAVGQKLQEAHKLQSSPWAVQPTEEEVTRYKK